MLGANEIIYNLNKALEMEYFDVFLYPREAKALQNKDKKIASVFEEFALMEIRHADLVSLRILNLGGKPVWGFSLLKDLTELKDILKRHFDYEQRAISFYGKLISEVDDETKIILKGIREDEKEHLEKIKELLQEIT